MTPENGKFQDVEITWLGHAAFQLKTPGGKTILIDPWLDNPKAPEGAKDISDVDIIAITHGHFDHVQGAPELAKKTGAKVVSIFEIAQYFGGKGVNEDNLVGMNIGGTAEVDGIKFSMTPAIHSSGLPGDDGIIEGGHPAGFVIEFENGYKVYHTGDTDYFGDLKHIGEFYEPDVMLTCIGDHFTMGPRAAAKAIQAVQPDHVIPMHYGTFPLLTGTPDALIDYLPEVMKKSVTVAEPGKALS